MLALYTYTIILLTKKHYVATCIYIYIIYVYVYVYSYVFMYIMQSLWSTDSYIAS